MSSGPLLTGAVTFAAWAVYLGGLASMQADCSSLTLTNGLQTAPNCSKSYRLEWFYMAWEFAAIAILVFAVVSQKLHQLRPAIVGLFAVGTSIFIYASDHFLTGQDLPYWSTGSAQNKIRTITAGAIMTAAMNAITIVVAGWACDDVKEPVAEKAAV